jgi:hypothetical protein
MEVPIARGPAGAVGAFEPATSRQDICHEIWYIAMGYNLRNFSTTSSKSHNGMYGARAVGLSVSLSDHADSYFQQRSIKVQRIKNAAKRDIQFNSDGSLIDRFLASPIMHPHNLVANHCELARRRERQPHMDRQ